jgi:pimeloyl-ACP methyl ester carboxylesterase
VPAPWRDEAAADLAGLTPNGLAAIVEEVSSFDRDGEARSLAAAGVDSLVCCGERDEVNLGMGGELAAALGTSLVLVPGAGHVANLDAPEAFNALLTGGDL